MSDPKPDKRKEIIKKKTIENKILDHLIREGKSVLPSIEKTDL